MDIFAFRKISYWISGALVVSSVLVLSVWGLRLGLDFTGGSLLEIEFLDTRPDNELVRGVTSSLGIGGVILQPTGDAALILRMKDLDESSHQSLLVALGKLGEFEEKRFNSIGPSIGSELKRKSLWALFFVILMIIIYISWAFRGISRPMASWKYGLAAIAALVHDILIPIGVFAVLGRFAGVEVDALFVTALLAILGFSVHDTIVVFDRIREKLNETRVYDDFEGIVRDSIGAVITRSINTSATTLLVLLSLIFFGGETTKFFALALALGIFFGTYSSIFVASSLLVSWYRRGLETS